MKFKGVVLLAALLLLVVVVGWFLAGKDDAKPLRTTVESAVQSSAPAVVPSAQPAPPVVASSAPGVAQPPPSSAPAAAAPAAVTGPGPVVMPFQNPPAQQRTASSPAMPAPAVASPNNPPAVFSPPASTTPEIGAVVALDLDKASLMLRDFRTLMGTNPVGTNAEIMKAVMGGNPKGATLGPPEGQNLNSNGELVDRWGTPYFFHQMSATSMEIHSAGPDKTLGTLDDIIQR